MNAVCLRGLGFGDEGKGTIVDFLARQYSINYVVRDNGGPQAAHNVVDQKNLWHCFAQFGSSMMVPNSRTFISGGMYIEPMAMLRENQALTNKGIDDGLLRTRIDSKCVIVTPFHRMVGRMTEAARGRLGYGSCGMGVGQTVFDRANGEAAIFLGDALDESFLEDKLAIIAGKKIAQARHILAENQGNLEVEKIYDDCRRNISLRQLGNIYLNFALASKSLIVDGKEQLNAITNNGNFIVEGAQGALLDPICGFAPYVTKTRTTMASAYDLIGGYAANFSVKKIGVVRAYNTRHGPGPFVTEEPRLGDIGEKHNTDNRWQKRFRTGWFDLVATRYAIDINSGIDSIALTNLDRLGSLNTIKVCTAYEYLGKETEDLDRLFICREISGNRIIIEGIKSDRRQTADPALAEMLFHCKPFEFESFSGWKRQLSMVKIFSDLPKETKTYIEYLQSEEGIDVPISIVSVGPRCDQKIVIHDPCVE